MNVSVLCLLNILRLDRLAPLCTMYVAALAVHVLCGICSKSEDTFVSE